MDISGLDFWTVCHVFHLKMFAFAVAVQDVFQFKMSVFVCFSVALFLISLQGPMSIFVILFMLAAVILSMLRAVILCLMLTPSRNREVVYFIYAESRTWS